MHTFFHGWRRKTGCVTLVMALGVSVLWGRSYLIRDEIHIPRPSRFYAVDSSHGGVQLESYRQAFADRFAWTHHRIDRSEPFGSLIFDGDIYWTFAGFAFHSGQYLPFNEPYSIWRVPYWALLLPLTLLSAYLILHNARKQEPPSP